MEKNNGLSDEDVDTIKKLREEHNKKIYERIEEVDQKEKSQ